MKNLDKEDKNIIDKIMFPFINKNFPILYFLFETYSFRQEIVTIGLKLFNCVIKMLDAEFPVKNHLEPIMKTCLIVVMIFQIVNYF